MNKNNVDLIVKNLKKEKVVALLAPSFIVCFDYPDIIHQLKKLGFDKVVELTFGAKLVNREYHKLLEKSKGLVISSPCPGIVDFVKQNYPQYVKNLARIDSPMMAMAKVCKKEYPKHKTCFISPCNFKKMEVDKSKYVDYVIDYIQLRGLFDKYKIKGNKKQIFFDKFYNDYTKIYPLSGGLAKTAHFKGVLKPGEERTIDGVLEIKKFLDKPDKKVKFLDCTFCLGGCIGGPHTCKIPLPEKRKKLMKYLDVSAKEAIPENRKGIVNKAKGLKFTF